MRSQLFCLAPEGTSSCRRHPWRLQGPDGARRTRNGPVDARVDARAFVLPIHSCTSPICFEVSTGRQVIQSRPQAAALDVSQRSLRSIPLCLESTRQPGITSDYRVPGAVVLSRRYKPARPGSCSPWTSSWWTTCKLSTLKLHSFCNWIISLSKYYLVSFILLPGLKLCWI